MSKECHHYLYKLYKKNNNEKYQSCEDAFNDINNDETLSPQQIQNGIIL